MKTVLFFMNNDNPAVSRLAVRGLSRYAKMRKWNVDAFVRTDVRREKKRLREVLRDLRPDGIVSSYTEGVQEVLPPGFPVAWLDVLPAKVPPGEPLVSHDSSRAVTLAAEELIRLNRTHFAAVGFQSGLPWSQKRIEDFRRAVKKTVRQVTISILEPMSPPWEKVGFRCEIYWRPNAAEHGLKAFGNTVRVKLTAWPVKDPPRFMVVDLKNGALGYYVDEDALPGGVKADDYKTNKLLLRKVAAKDQTFLEGAPQEELGRTKYQEGTQSGDVQATVKFSYNYYLGVYEFTVRQYEMVKSANADDKASISWKGVTKAKLPLTGVTWNEVRGGTFVGSYETSTVATDSVLGGLRTLTGGLIPFELPTEAQWEFACRAGTTSALYNGLELSDATTAPELAKICRYASNGGVVGGVNQGPGEVGSLEPNDWGFYDMLGNVGEFCRDKLDYWYNGLNLNKDKVNVEPCGWTGADRLQRRARGGNWSSAASECRCAARPGGNANYQSNSTWYSNCVGFRVSVTLD